MEYYTEIAIGAPQNRGKIINCDELPQYYEFVNQTAGGNKKHQQLYCSYYKFDKEVLDFVEKNGSIKGFDGNCYIDRILLDIDRGNQDNETVLSKTQKFVNDLVFALEIPENWIVPWFSGNGYHICLPNIFGFDGSKELPRVVKDTVEHYLPEGHDNIYDKSRLIRAPYSINSKTDLLKIPLTIDELFKLSYQEIHALAKPKPDLTQTIRKGIPISTPSIDTVLLEPIKAAKKEQPKQSKSVNLSDTTITPNQIAPCVQEMYKTGPLEGSRRNVLLRIISYYRRCGVLHSAAIAMALDWSKTGDGFGETEARQIVDYIYYNDRKYTCIDFLMDSHCKEACLYYQSKKKGNDPLIPVYSAQEVNEMYWKRIQDRKLYPGFNLRDQMSIDFDYWVRPTELVTLMADSGIGKTTLLQNMVARSSAKVLWLGLEFDLGQLLRRFRQFTEQSSLENINGTYNEESGPPDISNSTLNNIKFIQSSPNLQALRRVVCEEMPQMLIIDTIDCISVDNYGGSEKAKLDQIMVSLKDIAIKQNIIIIGVSHIPKAESERVRNTGQRLNMHSGMGTAAIAQKSDHIWALNGRDTSKIRTFQVTKGRDVSKFEYTFQFDANTFEFKDLDPHQQDGFVQLSF